MLKSNPKRFHIFLKAWNNKRTWAGQRRLRMQIQLIKDLNIISKIHRKNGFADIYLNIYLDTNLKII